MIIINDCSVPLSFGVTNYSSYSLHPGSPRFTSIPQAKYIYLTPASPKVSSYRRIIQNPKSQHLHYLNQVWQTCELENKLQIQWWDRHRITVIAIPISKGGTCKEGRGHCFQAISKSSRANSIRFQSWEKSSVAQCSASWAHASTLWTCG